MTLFVSRLNVTECVPLFSSKVHVLPVYPAPVLNPKSPSYDVRSSGDGA